MEIKSKIRGRKNYVAWTWDNVVQVGMMNRFDRQHFVHDVFTAQHGMTSRFFTYKKDLLEAIEKYQALGYKVVWR